MKLYWTPALPEHYVAEKEDGSQWLLPVSPISPAAWAQAKPYNGNYTLEPVPEHIARFYRAAPRTEALRIRVTPTEKARHQQAADKAGMTLGAYIRSKLE